MQREAGHPEAPPGLMPLDALCAERGEAAAGVRAAIAAGRLPQPSLVAADGTALVPRDYFALVDDAGGGERLRAVFEERYVLAADMLGALAGPDELDEAWESYLDGRFGLVFDPVAPETAVQAVRLGASIESLLERPEPADWRWQNRLRARVEQLAALLREPTPAARERLGDDHPWDLWVTPARAGYPAAFA